MDKLELKWFKNYNNFDSIPETAGVYIISTKREYDNEYEAIYVGQASNLQQRAKDHWSPNETNTALKNHIAKNPLQSLSHISSKSCLASKSVRLLQSG